jgi:osmoprotectant transport system substrate-binding protein
VSRMWRALAVGCSALLVAGCTGGGASVTARPADAVVVVGSFNFAESRLLAELYAQAIERAGLRVRREFDLGTRELVEPALERGLVELVPEYQGSLLTFLTAEPAGSDPDEVHTALVDTLRERGLTALDAAPAQDRNTVVVTADTASRWGLQTVSDLRRVDQRFAFGGPPECPHRPLCLQGLSSAYGLSFRRFVGLDEGGPVTVDALMRDHVQAALMFSSDGAIRANHLAVLRDDRHLQPAENVTPVVSTSVLDRFGPELADAVDAVSALLTTEVLRTLNELVSVRGRSAQTVAAEWLAEHGPASPG